MGDFGEDSDDSDGEGGLGNVNRIIMRPPGHSGKAKRGHLCFDASFETGNLGRVDLINEYEYDLFIRPDTCNPKLRFWFNFTVDNVKQDQRVIFNLVNMSKGRNLFNMAMTPIVKSSTRPKWQRITKRNVFYHKSPLHRGNYVLSFAFTFDKEDEVYQFSLTFPYSYTRQQAILCALETKASHLEDQFSREQIGSSIQKRKVDVITIGNETSAKPTSKQRIILILARIHPGDSPSSFVCQGLMEIMISAHPIANLLRENVTFKIIPMLNPDGVFLGNYRSSLMGFDLNRSWHRASPFAHPILTAVIDFVESIDRNKENQLDFVIDLHANTTLSGCFIYGNSYDDVYRYERHIVYPKLLANLADDYDRLNAIFNADGNKTGTARRYFCTSYGDKINSYSFEVSFYGYKLKGADTIIPYTEESYKRCGMNLVRAFLEYYQATGVIPINLTQEIKEKRRRPRTYRCRSATRNSSRSRPATTRIAAPVHYNDISAYYDSETSADEFPSTFRNRFSPRKFIDNDKMKTEVRKVSPTHTAIAVPEPCLSIIDFNIITREDFEKSNKHSKEKDK